MLRASSTCERRRRDVRHCPWGRTPAPLATRTWLSRRRRPSGWRHPQHPRRPRAGTLHRARAVGRRRAVGGRRVAGAVHALVGGPACALPGAGRRGRAVDGGRVGRRRRRPQARADPARPVLRDAWFDQLRQAMALLARWQLAHGDLSAYNILAAGERLVIIDAGGRHRRQPVRRRAAATRLHQRLPAGPCPRSRGRRARPVRRAGGAGLVRCTGQHRTVPGSSAAFAFTADPLGDP